MNLTRAHKRSVVALLLLCVVFTAALSFSGGYATKESGLGGTAKENSALVSFQGWHPCLACTAEGRHDADPCEHQDQGDSCSHVDSHETVGPQLYLINHLPHVSSSRPFEPFQALPEVYLENFIPPQNLT